MAGFIIGFDGEKAGAGQRIVNFVEKTAIPTALFSMLQALPDTALWHRLTKENRLRSQSVETAGSQTSLMNYIPTRPLEDIATEYINAFWDLYEPSKFLDRTYRHFLMLGEATYPKKENSTKQKIEWVTIRALFTICWRQGLVRNTRWQFWRNLFNMAIKNPGGLSSYLSTCALAEHFVDYRIIVRREIEAQLADFLALEAEAKLNSTGESESIDPPAEPVKEEATPSIA
jgi:hypothetical protein